MAYPLRTVDQLYLRGGSAPPNPKPISSKKMGLILALIFQRLVSKTKGLTVGDVLGLPLIPWVLAEKIGKAAAKLPPQITSEKSKA